MSRSRTVALATLTAVIWAVTATAAGAAAWVRGPLVGAPDEYLSGALGVAADGAATVGWVTPDASVRVARIAPDGALGGEQTLGTGPDSQVRVATNAAGISVLTWIAADGAVKLVRIAPGGEAGAPVTVAPGPALHAAEVAIDARGDATVAWFQHSPADDVDAVFARRVLADGTLTPARLLHETLDRTTWRVVAAPGGLSWVAGVRGLPGVVDAEVWAARLDADGTVASTEVVAAPGRFADKLSLAVGDDASGAVLSWTEGSFPSTATIRARRLTTTGAVAGATLPLDVDVDPFSSLRPAALAVAPGGTATVVWLQETGGVPALYTRRFPAAGAPSAVQQLQQDPLDPGMPMFATAVAGADGTVLVLHPLVRSESADVIARRIAPDGTIGASETVGPMYADAPGQTPIVGAALDAAGGATVAYVTGTALDALAIQTVAWDVAGPSVAVTVPDSIVVGTEVTLAATVLDRSPFGAINWELGDGASATGPSVRHVYAAVGDYELKLTVADSLGYETVVRRTVRVVAQPVDPGPGPGPGPGADPGGPGPRPGGPGPVDPPVRAVRGAAALKLAAVVRSGARVTVRGTIARSAGGRVTIAWSQKAGRRTVVRRASARIARGRWSATLRLPASLARATRGNATVRVSYAGDADTRAASAKRVVKLARRAPAKRGR